MNVVFLELLRLKYNERRLSELKAVAKEDSPETEETKEMVYKAYDGITGVLGRQWTPDTPKTWLGDSPNGLSLSLFLSLSLYSHIQLDNETFISKV